LKHRLSAWMKKEELKGDEFSQRPVHYCEPEQGSFLGEDEDGDDEGRSFESLMKCQESSEHHVGMMSEASNETMESYVFKTNKLCMFTRKISKGRIERRIKMLK
jgi:hypothetical protein